MMKKQQEPREQIRNQQLINLIKCFAQCLSGYNLLDSFQANKSFKIFIRTLRKVNTDEEKITYTEKEEKAYEEKVKYIKKIKEKQLQSIQNSSNTSQFIFPQQAVKSEKVDQEIEYKISKEEHEKLNKKVQELGTKSLKILDEYSKIKDKEKYKDLREQVDRATNLIQQEWVKKFGMQKYWKSSELSNIRQCLMEKDKELDECLLMIEKLNGELELIKEVTKPSEKQRKKKKQ